MSNTYMVREIANGYIVNVFYPEGLADSQTNWHFVPSVEEIGNAVATIKAIIALKENENYQSANGLTQISASGKQALDKLFNGGVKY